MYSCTFGWVVAGAAVALKKQHRPYHRVRSSRKAFAPHHQHPNLLDVCIVPVQDIDGTSSLRLHRDTNKPDRQLYHDDIDGSNCRNKWLFRTKRCVNPLEPEYTLPSFVAAPAVAPKFTRDSHDVSDIEGTKSRPLFPLAQRKNHLVEDIEGAQSGWKPRHVRARQDAPPLDHSLNVSDITAGGFRTRRETNPLAPSYRVNGMDVVDDPIKSKPRTLPKARDSPFYSLTTADIEGAQSGWRPLPQVNPPIEARRHFRNTNFMGDIPGAQADTVKHSICTDRHVNPLNPVYASLDGEPLANPQTPLYKEPACVEAEKQLDRAIMAEEDENSATAAATTTTASMSARVTDSAVSDTHQGKNQPRVEETNGRNRNQEDVVQSEQNLVAPRQQRRPVSDPLPSARDRVDGTYRSKGSNGGGGSGEGRRSPRQQQQHQQRNDDPLATRASPFSNGNRVPDNEKHQYIRLLEHEIRLLRKEGGGGAQGESWQKPPLPSSGAAVAPSTGSSNGGRISARSWPGATPASERGQGSTHAGHTHKAVKNKKNGYPESPNPCYSASSGPTGERLKRSAARAVPRQDSSRSGSVNSGGGRGMAGVGFDVRSGGGGGLVVRSRGDERAERLVLRSSNGTPRVPLTPSERRSAMEYTEDVSSVRGLA